MRRRLSRPLRRTLAGRIPPLLIRANQSMNAGSYVDAAQDLEQLALAAEGRRGPRAPVFHIQAGRARLLAGQSAMALQQFERGLGLLAARGRSGRLARLGPRIVAELREHGAATEARQLSGYLENLSPGLLATAQPTQPAKHPHLPTHCPGCGAPVHPAEIEWLDDATGECAYCGSPLRQV
jgi:hypothetical protein